MRNPEDGRCGVTENTTRHDTTRDEMKCEDEKADKRFSPYSSPSSSCSYSSSILSFPLSWPIPSGSHSFLICSYPTPFTLYPPTFVHRGNLRATGMHLSVFHRGRLLMDARTPACLIGRLVGRSVYFLRRRRRRTTNDERLMSHDISNPEHGI